MPKPLKKHERRYQIYALIDPRDNNIRYVGMSADVNYRFYQHTLRDGGRQERAWIKELQDLNIPPTLEILETVEPNDYSTACIRERYWMVRLQEAGYPLVNVFGTKHAYHSYSQRRADRQKSTTNHTQDKEASATVLFTSCAINGGRVIKAKSSSLVTTDKQQFSELIENMPATQAELARLSGLSERSIIRIKDGETVLRSTANKVLRGLSQIYGQTFTLSNVTGINISDR